MRITLDPHLPCIYSNSRSVKGTSRNLRRILRTRGGDRDGATSSRGHHPRRPTQGAGAFGRILTPVKSDERAAKSAWLRWFGLSDILNYLGPQALRPSRTLPRARRGAGPTT